MAKGFNGNGGPTGIQAWTKKYQVTMSFLLRLLSAENNEVPVRGTSKKFYYDELIELGIIEITEYDTYKLNIEKLSEHSLVVPDELYNDLTDLDKAREIRYKLGLVETLRPGRRERQNARRRRRYAEVKKRRAELDAQPKIIDDIPLSEVMFKD